MDQIDTQGRDTENVGHGVADIKALYAGRKEGLINAVDPDQPYAADRQHIDDGGNIALAHTTKCAQEDLGQTIEQITPADDHQLGNTDYAEYDGNFPL